MKCCNCGKPVESRDFCGNCLVKTIEKRARKAMQKKGIRPSSKIMVVNDGSCEGEVNLHLAGELFDPKNTKVKAELETGSDFICVPDTADKIAGDFLDSMLNSGIPVQDEAGSNAIIRLLGDSLSEEVFAYAKTKAIQFREGKQSYVTVPIIDKLEERHKGTKFALAKSAKMLK